MNYFNPHIRLVARRISILCAAFFVVFSYLYLYFFQGDLMTQVHFQLSDGEFNTHAALSAALCTLLLFLVGLFCIRLLHWLPLRLMATGWFFPFLILGWLTHWRLPQFGDSGASPSWMLFVFPSLFFALLIVLGRAFPDSSKENGTFATYAWPNALLLVLFASMTIGLSNTDASVHTTLRSARYLSQQRYEKVLSAARHEPAPSRQLSAIVSMALSETGQLGERLFSYPQPNGSEGLIPQLSDTALFVNLPYAVGHHLGYVRGGHTSADFFLEVINQKPKARPASRDYQLSAYLLDRNLDGFYSVLLQGDSLSVNLPRHYREASLLYQQQYPQTEEILEDSLLSADFKDFLAMLNGEGSAQEREMRCRRRYGNTYWCYFYFR